MHHPLPLALPLPRLPQKRQLSILGQQHLRVQVDLQVILDGFRLLIQTLLQFQEPHIVDKQGQVIHNLLVARDAGVVSFFRVIDGNHPNLHSLINSLHLPLQLLQFLDRSAAHVQIKAAARQIMTKLPPNTLRASRNHGPAGCR